MLRSIRPLAVVCALLLAGIATPAFAGTSSGTMASSVTLSGDCSLTVNAMSFGTSSALVTGTVNANTPMQVTCTSGTAYTIAIGASVTTTGTAAATPTAGYNHMMTSNGFGVNGRPLYLPYNVTQDVAGTKPWGYTTGTDTVAGTGTGQTTPLTVYGNIPVNTTGNVAGRPSALIPGNYVDTLTVTLSY